MKVFTFDFDTASVVEREGASLGYPNIDSSGAVMFENTHFATAREAWLKLVSEAEAAVSIDCRMRDVARKAFDAATTRLADSSERLMKAKANEP